MREEGQKMHRERGELFALPVSMSLAWQQHRARSQVELNNVTACLHQDMNAVSALPRAEKRRKEGND